MVGSATGALRRALDVLEQVADLVDERVSDEGPPAWAERRGWTAFLEALDDEALFLCETRGLAGSLGALRGVPDSLAEIARAAEEACRLPALPAAAAIAPLRGVGPRKALQLAGLVAAIRPMAHEARRVVDVGAGKGHFGRAASEVLGKEVLGLERDPIRVRAALALSGGSARASVVCRDALAEPIPAEAGDLLLGLHACGELGDRTASVAAELGIDLALVSCCLQKVRGPGREALSALGRRRGMSVRKEVLGLSNLASREQGVELPISGILASRESRIALRRLLKRRGVSLEPGEELRGVNRRQADAGLEMLARRVLGKRGLPPPTPGELAWAAADARRRWAKTRRWNLPRAGLGRLLEVAVNLDRAALLEERGMASIVAVAFHADVSARNVAVFGSAEARRLPVPRAAP